MNPLILLGALAGTALLGAIFFLVTRRWPRIDRVLLALAPIALVVVAGQSAKRVLDTPYEDWNAARLTPSAAMLRGYDLYYGPEAGPIHNSVSNGSSGPVTPLVYLPAALPSTPTEAVLAGAGVSALLYFLPLALMMALGGAGSGRDRLLPLYGFLLCGLFTFSLVDTLSFGAFSVHSDAPTIGFAALACVLLWRGERSAAALWASALFLVLSAWSKPTSAPVLLFLPAFLALSGRAGLAGRYLVRVLAFTVLVSAALLFAFGPGHVAFNLVGLPADQPFWLGRTGSFASAARALSWSVLEMWRESALLLGLLAFGALLPRFASAAGDDGETREQPTWCLPAVAALAMAPLAAFARAHYGGKLHNLTPVLFFLMTAAVLALLRCAADRDRDGTPKATAGAAKLALAIGIVCLLGIHGPTVRRVPESLERLHDNVQERAYEYAKANPGKAYFPWSPLSSLLAEGELYHFAYALFDRDLARVATDEEHLRAHLPAEMEIVVFGMDSEHDREAVVDVMKHLPEFEREVTAEPFPGTPAFARP